MHPKSRIRAIWDTFVLSKTPQIFKKAHLGCICPLKNTPNSQKSTFGMHSPPRKYPKSRIRAIWDTFAPEKVSQKVAKPPAQILARITNIFPLSLKPEEPQKSGTAGTNAGTVPLYHIFEGCKLHSGWNGSLQ